MIFYRQLVYNGPNSVIFFGKALLYKQKIFPTVFFAFLVIFLKLWFLSNLFIDKTWKGRRYKRPKKVWLVSNQNQDFLWFLNNLLTWLAKIFTFIARGLTLSKSTLGQNNSKQLRSSPYIKNIEKEKLTKFNMYKEV